MELPWKSNFVYVMRCGIHHKIGMSQDVVKRRADIQTSNPEDIDILFYADLGMLADYIETSLHKKYNNYLVRGEWFALDEAGEGALYHDMRLLEEISLKLNVILDFSAEDTIACIEAWEETCHDRED